MIATLAYAVVSTLLIVGLILPLGWALGPDFDRAATPSSPPVKVDGLTRFLIALMLPLIVVASLITSLPLRDVVYEWGVIVFKGRSLSLAEAPEDE